MYGSGYIFSKKFFTGWIVVLFIWIWITAFVVIIGPIWEGRQGIYNTFRGIYWDLTGRTWKLRQWQNENPEQMHAVRSQVSAELTRITSLDGVRNDGGYITPHHIDEELEEKK